MRQLTIDQKARLDQWYEENWKALKKVGGILHFQLDKCDQFPYELLEELQEMNDTEILWQNINRYISDKGCADTRSVKPWEI